MLLFQRCEKFQEEICPAIAIANDRSPRLWRPLVSQRSFGTRGLDPRSILTVDDANALDHSDLSGRGRGPRLGGGEYILQHLQQVALRRSIRCPGGDKSLVRRESYPAAITGT